MGKLFNNRLHSLSEVCCIRYQNCIASSGNSNSSKQNECLNRKNKTVNLIKCLSFHYYKQKSARVYLLYLPIWLTFRRYLDIMKLKRVGFFCDFFVFFSFLGNCSFFSVIWWLLARNLVIFYLGLIKMSASN